MHHYWVVYKPFQVLCQFSPQEGKRTLADLWSQMPKDVYPVGRLDYDSEGLLLLTNDKAITHQLLTPTHRHPRTYYVQVEGSITPEAFNALEHGVVINIDGKPYKTQPAKAGIFEVAPQLPDRDPPIRYRKNVPDSWLWLTLTEGKNRQVRRMTAAVGFPTLRLVRYAIGAYTLSGLQPGQCKALNALELQELMRGQPK
jgi:23S rRNA pseudouridine2457 synthase